MTKETAMATITEKIEYIKSLDTSKQNESTARTAIVLPMLRALGWNTADPDEVYMEYEVAKHLKGYADIALLVQGAPLIFIETKAPRHSLETEKHKIQLLEYCQMKQVRIGVLTNGLEWRIYYLGAGADKNSALAKIIDLTHEKTENSAKMFMNLLSRDAVSDTRALTSAKHAWHDTVLSNLWKGLLEQGDKLLVKRLKKEAKEKRGVSISPDVVRKFIMARATSLDTVEEISAPPAPTQQDEQQASPSSPKLGEEQPKKKRPVRVRMFGVEHEFRTLKEIIVNFALQACHCNETELKSLAQRLESDGRKLIMVRGDEKSSLVRSPKRIGETNYWLGTLAGKTETKRQCDRIRKALSLPEDVLVWLD